MKEKKFINGVFINEVQFDNGGSKLSVSIPANGLDSLIDQLKQNIKKDRVKLEIIRLKAPKVSAQGKQYATHYMAVDEWEPGQQESGGYIQPAEAHAKFAAMKQVVETEKQNDDVPF